MVTTSREKKTTKKEEPEGTSTNIQKYQGPMSERFTVAVLKEFGNTAGMVELTVFQRRLAQHLFIKIDTALSEFEKKRMDSGKDTLPIIWQNINMTKLALSAMDRIELGLDALIPNHIWPIPYFNKRLNKYDLDLRIGYIGKDYYTRKVAFEEPEDIRYELVYETDTFEVIKKSRDNPIESYQFHIERPFKDRGNIVGGFGYITYENESKNRVVIVTSDEFEKSRSKAQNDEFWKNYPAEMKMKTLVHRVTAQIRIDPEKVNAAYLRAEDEEDFSDAATVQAEIEVNANTGSVIMIPEEKGQIEEKKTTPEDELKPQSEKAGEKPNGEQLRQPGF